jgi:hypothetical protein
MDDDWGEPAFEHNFEVPPNKLTRPDVEDSPAASGTSTPAPILPPKPAGKSKWADEDEEDEEEVSCGFVILSQIAFGGVGPSRVRVRLRLATPL